MFAEERRRLIADHIQRSGRVTVRDLAVEFDVTTETVRRDLAALEDLGLCRRVHGGAVPADQPSIHESGVDERSVERLDEKRRIAVAAAREVPRVASLVLDGGSTTEALAHALADANRTGGAGRRLTVATNSIGVVLAMHDAPGIEVQVLPGLVRALTRTAVGAVTVDAISRLRADLTFLGANGVDAQHGLSTPDQSEASTKAALVRAGRRTVVLADGSKLGKDSFVRFAALDEIDLLITNEPGPRAVDPELARALDEADVEVVLA
ncbi:DeoR/GlpR family DNA-binding transcription regulator [Brevibacterium litoralis]|uniref:DeoR/GlpR family DNA-binding transcription regulator n=1 Tax=Brevibacterium litoralis TaxID=3138935 RepID=UPI0032EBD91C